MIPLLVLTGLLLVASGGLKLVRAVGAGLQGLALLCVLELIGGVGLTFLTLASPPSAEGGFRLIAGAFGLLLVSSLSYGFRLRAMRRRREASEGARLVTYVKYLSAQEGTEER